MQRVTLISRISLASISFARISSKSISPVGISPQQARMPQKREPIKMEEPADWLKMVENIRHVRKKYPAPVDSMGCDQAHSNSDKSVDQRFQVLLSLILSSQTKDPVTWAAVQRLKQAGMGNVQGILSAKEKDIEDLIHPVGFYRRKAVYLKEAAEKIVNEFGGEIPNSVPSLCTLKGVGPKMAHLCMQEAWNVNSGIGVDTHVHRISARLGWVPKGVKTPEQTREALESWMPREYWREINHLLVGFGQTICAPLHPKCADCTNNELCPSSSVRSKRPAKSKVKEEPPSVNVDVKNEEPPTVATEAEKDEPPPSDAFEVEKEEEPPAVTVEVKKEEVSADSIESTPSSRRVTRSTGARPCGCVKRARLVKKE